MARTCPRQRSGGRERETSRGDAGALGKDEKATPVEELRVGGGEKSKELVENSFIYLAGGELSCKPRDPD